MLSASHTVSVSDYQTAFRSHWRSALVPRAMFFLFQAWGLYLLITGFISLSGGAHLNGGLGALIQRCAFGLFLLLLPRLVAWRTAQAMRNHPAIGTETRWHFDEKGIRFTGKHADGVVDWSAIIASSSFPECHLFYPQKNMFLWVPASAFARPEDFEALRELLRRNTKHRDFS